MNKSSPPITQNPLIYYSQLKSVNGVKFTPREIDVIACLLSGKGSKTIAHFLSIEEKTVETHKYNIMRKLECNSKEGIIEFIEKSDKFSVLKQHYLTLLSEAIFEKHLSKILSFNRNIRHSSLLFYEKNSHFINQLENHLKRAGINIFGESLDKHKSLPQLIHHITAQEVESIIYIISRPLLEKMKEPDNQSKLEMAELTQKLAQNNTRVIFVLERDDISLEIPQEIRDAGYVDFGTEDSYYFTVLKVLQTLLPKVDLDKFTSDFKHQYQTIYESSAKTSSQTWSPIDDLPQAENSGSSISSVFSKQKRKIVVFGSTLVLSSTCLLFLTLNNNSYYPKGPSEKIHNLQSIRSDLPIPADKTLLNRPELLKQIDEALKGNEGIQTVALVGIGGAGKTTLARQYAQKQKAPIIWEINAETKGSFIGSFENLAYSLCRRDEERKTLRELQDIKNSLDRQERIILFVKERLKLYPNWVLIFDNIEKFDSLQTYFPSDSATWGSGKIIVTTRDANIQNNNHINQTIHIGELKRQEKYLLFSNIMHQGNIHNISTPHQEQTHKFLNHLPPFPLDISIAAYYLKTTNVTYEKYLEYLKEYNQSFESIQENILKETNEYTKTRYGIVTLSLKNLIEINEIFPSLLLFVSLLDSQNIPKDLLSTLKEGINK
ncbi:MAG: LuxR C-terminal-related transcriptional regulator [Alphaproteobacteria bacterium]|nr:LuxR C-terminal-related transcriptional regulator [Alphaproteobacteria bacterium]